MIRCTQCGKPVGVGRVRLGDRIACADCADVKEFHTTTADWQKQVQRQMHETRQEKASGDAHRQYPKRT